MWLRINVPFRAKTNKVKNELENPALHPKLIAILYDLANYVNECYNVDIEVTHVFRTEEQQRDIYGKDSTNYSPHQFWNAVDIVLANRDHTKLKHLEEYVDSRYKYYGSPGFTTSLAHDVGLGRHLHIQVGPYQKR